jgi:signal transduction histidine kinase/CheY-like chemotaxis protein
MIATYTKTLSRKFISVFILVVIILSVLALFIRSSMYAKADKIAVMARETNFDQSGPQRALLLVHQAEDCFQESLLTAGKEKSKAYKSKLFQAINVIDSLLNEKPDSSALSSSQFVKIHYWYHQKVKLSDKLYLLKHSFDSLLTAYSAIDTAVNKSLTSVNLTSHSRKIKSFSYSDTVTKNPNGRKKGLLGRIKDAIANNGGKSPNTVEINHNSTSKIVDAATQKIIARDKNLFALKLKQLQQHNMKVLSTQKDLIALNVHLTNELEAIINQEKEIIFNVQNEFNKLAVKSYRDTNTMLNSFFLAALFLLLVVAVLVILFINKLDKSETALWEENKRAVTIAQQKMDLLLHMSHEIRNPLTSIQGFLYIFRRNPLTDRQKEMLDAIKLSSDMLLQTLNDTLDAAKMESSEFKINKDPFNPSVTLKEIIESMEFSAAKKNLDLNYNFEGDQNAVLLGDAFRLRQIMVNLISNAVKYTKTGSINVNARLGVIEGKNGLQIAVIDTGEGISAEQQLNLFSKFYQTNSSKGKTGSGLGLFICKELVQAQGGQISVTSEVDKGSTFSFFIPYDAYKSSGNSETSGTLPMLNGISILAVDDNELNLMLLKMLTKKWNVKFYQAAGGKAALEILAKEEITVILTDIQMPGMDGNELLAAIRQLRFPKNNVPVIVMTGEQADMGNLLKHGFSGALIKPFVEAELIRQIAAAIKA